jgi:hypothetical protein
MIAVNEALGYTILGRPGCWWKLEVAAVKGDGEVGGQQELASQARN